MLFPSRVLKTADTLSKNKMFNKIFLIGLSEKKKDINKNLNNRISIIKFYVSSNTLFKNIFFILIKALIYYLKIFLFIKKNKIKYISIHNVNLIPLAIILDYFLNCKIIYDTHELETEKNEQGFIKKKLFKFFEYIYIKKFKLIFVVSESIGNWYKKTYNIKKPIVIYNTPKFDKFKKNNAFRNKFSISKKKIIFLYQGGLTFNRGIEECLDVFKKLEKKNVVLVLMGYGKLKEKILIYQKKYSNIFYHPAVNMHKILKYTSSADIGLSLIKNSSLSYNFSMPNKLFEYLLSGLPVVVSNLFEMKKFVKKYKCGWVVKPQQIRIKKIIQNINKGKLKKVKINLKKISKLYNWQSQEKKIIYSYKNMISN